MNRKEDGFSIPRFIPSNEQCQALLKSLQRKKFADVTFYIGAQKTEFKANRSFLAAHSSVFEAMLYGQMQESKPNAEIAIHDIESDAFQSVLNYCYCNDPKLSPTNIIGVRQIADKYRINGLSKLCDEYFPQCINYSNFCTLLNQAVNIKLDLYIKKCAEIMRNILGQHALRIITSNGFRKMSINSMKTFLQYDHLKIREEDLWDAVLRWKQYQISILHHKKRANTDNNLDDKQPQRKKQRLNNGLTGYNTLINITCNHNNNKSEYVQMDDMKEDDDIDNKMGIKLLKEICPFIRFGLMDGKYFVKRVKSMKVLTLQQVADILTYYQCNDEKCGQFCIKSRRFVKSYRRRRGTLTQMLSTNAQIGSGQ